MATLAVRRTDPEGFRDPNIVKAVVGRDGYALYFSRTAVPSPPAVPGGAAPPEVDWNQHIGIYAYRRQFLIELASLPPTPLEQRERLEQLRVLEHGHRIRVGFITHPHLGIDTREEYQRFVEEHRRQPAGAARARGP
jgi:3-deoxy-manno-octulosonate cytidylyltransferase (CMP-KDO synthetase)